MNAATNTPTDACPDPFLGLVVSNLFEIESLIGKGASSRVYRAAQLGLQRCVAIKILNREYLQATDIRARFHREARIATRITHPAVVPVLMTGELPSNSLTQGEAFIVYEFVDGLTLRTILDTKGPFSIEMVLGIVVSAGQAVGSAHALGIVHRDLKPENLMIVPKSQGPGRLRVLDFGLAKLYESSELPLTHTGAILGTPTYLSPEGARGQPATSRSDVYSLATIAYECLTGQPPFKETSPVRVLMQQIECEPPPLKRPLGSGEVSAAIARVILDNLVPAQK